MSRDVFAFVAPQDVRRLEDLPKGYRMPRIGSRDEVIATVRRFAPSVDESDPAWLVVHGADYLVEVSLGSETDLDSFMFFARSGEGSSPLMLTIADALKVTLFDTSTGSILSAHGD